MARGVLCVLIAIALCCVFPAGPSMAAEFKVDPYLTVREEYNDNIFLDFPVPEKRMPSLRGYYQG